MFVIINAPFFETFAFEKYQVGVIRGRDFLLMVCSIFGCTVSEM